MIHLSPRWGYKSFVHDVLYTFRPAGAAHFDILTLFRQVIILLKTHKMLKMLEISVCYREKLSKL